MPSWSRTAAGLTLVLPATTLTAAQNAYAAGPPAFVQQATGHGAGATLAIATPNATTAGNRLVVEVGVWNAASATATGVTDNAGDTFVKVTGFAATDHTQMTIWTAPVA